MAAKKSTEKPTTTTTTTTITQPEIPARSLYEQGLSLTDVLLALHGDLPEGPLFMRLVAGGRDKWVDVRAMQYVPTSEAAMARRPVDEAAEWSYDLRLDLRRHPRMYVDDSVADQAAIGVTVSGGIVADRDTPLAVSPGHRHVASYQLAAMTGPSLQTLDYEAERRAIERLRDRGVHVVVRAADTLIGFWRLSRAIPSADARRLSARLAAVLGGEVVELEAPRPVGQGAWGTLANAQTREVRQSLFTVPKPTREHVGRLVPRFEISAIGVTDEVVEPEALAKLVDMDLSKPAPPAPEAPKPAQRLREHSSMQETWQKIMS